MYKIDMRGGGAGVVQKSFSTNIPDGLFMFKVELTPPSPGELGQVVKSSAKLVQVHI